MDKKIILDEESLRKWRDRMANSPSRARKPETKWETRDASELDSWLKDIPDHRERRVVPEMSRDQALEHFLGVQPPKPKMPKSVGTSASGKSLLWWAVRCHRIGRLADKELRTTHRHALLDRQMEIMVAFRDLQEQAVQEARRISAVLRDPSCRLGTARYHRTFARLRSALRFLIMAHPDEMNRFTTKIRASETFADRERSRLRAYGQTPRGKSAKASQEQRRRARRALDPEKALADRERARARKASQRERQRGYELPQAAE